MKRLSDLIWSAVFWVREKQIERQARLDDDTPDPDYDPAAVIERWIAKHIDPDRGDGMQRSWDW